MTYTFDESTVSDLHKDAFGYLPREWFWEQWDSSPPEDKQIVVNNLLRASRNDLAEREELTYHD